MKYRVERINGHEYIVGERGEHYLAICGGGGDDEVRPLPFPACPRHETRLLFLNNSSVLLDFGGKLQILYCSEVKCNYVYIPELERNVAGWTNILAVVTAARQAASHKKITEYVEELTGHVETLAKHLEKVVHLLLQKTDF